MAFKRAPIPARPPALTEHTITDPTRLSAELARVRRDDFAEAIEELEIGLAAIAAPVRGAGGQVVAALSITGPTVRMTPARITELKPILIEEAGILSRRLGNTEQGEHAA
jgi:DNA-binding IclR family transcriptional regulator